MKDDFKRAGYFAAIAIFIIGALSLVGSSAASYFSYDTKVVLAGEFVSLFALAGLLIICVTSKRKYNGACVKFAEYILKSREKEASHIAQDAERAKQLQNMQNAAAHEREEAVAAALEKGRHEGAVQAARMMPPQPRMIPEVYQTVYRPYIPRTAPNEEVLYNEYGEPVVVRRRIKKQRTQVQENYDRYGTLIYEPSEKNADTFLPNQTENQSIKAPANLPENQEEIEREEIPTPKPKPINIDPYRINL